MIAINYALIIAERNPSPAIEGVCSLIYRLHSMPLKKTISFWLFERLSYFKSKLIESFERVVAKTVFFFFSFMGNKMSKDTEYESECAGQRRHRAAKYQRSVSKSVFNFSSLREKSAERHSEVILILNKARRRRGTVTRRTWSCSASTALPWNNRE